MKPLLLAVLSAVLAGSAVAQTETAPIPDGSKGATKYDFTIRPKLKPHPDRKARDASKVATVEEAKALSKDLFVTYQNLSSLTLFRFHKRTKDEAPMTADELGWAETEMKDEMAIAEKLAPEAETALKVGIERPKPLNHGLKIGRFRRAMSGIMPRSNKPTYEEYRRGEHYAMSAIMSDLWSLVDLASERLDDPEEIEKESAEARLDLDKSYEALAYARKGMLEAAKEADAKPKDEAATSGAARQRAEKAAGTGPKGGSTAKGAAAFGVRDSGARITPEEAAREANAVEQRAANRKRGRSPAIVPAP